MGLFGKKKKDLPIAMVGGDGTYSFRNVVGESHYRDALKRLIAKAPAEEKQNGEVFTKALLLREPTNQFDPNAVAVMIDGNLVGYIGRDDTGDIHDALRQCAEAGYSDQAMGVQAVIGWNAASADPVIGVRLDLIQA